MPLHINGQPVKQAVLPPDQQLAIAIASHGASDRSYLFAIQAIAVALAWESPRPAPWEILQQEEVARLQSVIKGEEDFLLSCGKDKTPAGAQNARETRDSLAKLHNQLHDAKQALAATAVHMPIDHEETVAMGRRVLAALKAVGIPLIQTAREGSKIITEAKAQASAGFEEYAALEGRGFSNPPDGPTSAGGSSLPISGAVIPPDGSP